MPLIFIWSSVVTVEPDSLFDFARVAARPASLWCDICLSDPIRGQLRMSCLLEATSFKPKHVCLHHCLFLRKSTCPITVLKFHKWHKKGLMYVCFPIFWRSHHKASHGWPQADPSPTTSQHPDNRLPYTNRGVTNAMLEERHMLRKCRSLTPAFLSLVLEASRHKRLAELDLTGCWRAGWHTNFQRQLSPWLLSHELELCIIVRES